RQGTARFREAHALAINRARNGPNITATTAPATDPASQLKADLLAIIFASLNDLIDTLALLLGLPPPDATTNGVPDTSTNGEAIDTNGVPIDTNGVPIDTNGVPIDTNGSVNMNCLERQQPLVRVCSFHPFRALMPGNSGLRPGLS
ncbi:MAG: hypothetical protein V2A79_14180, partial [Planctomycetota bacterium]